MEVQLLPGCASDVEDLLERYEETLAESRLSRSTFDKRLGCPDFRTRIIGGRITPRVMASIRRRLEGMKGTYT